MHIESIYFRKTTFFFLLILLVITPFVASKFYWLARARRTHGIMAFKGQGFAGDQIKEDYSVICFQVDGDTIWFNGLGNIAFRPGEPIGVRYQPSNPADARVDIFAGIWGDTLINAGIPVLMLLALFVHPKVVPWGRKVKLTRKHPYIIII